MSLAIHLPEYRIQPVGHAVHLRLVDRSGTQHCVLSKALSAIASMRGEAGAATVTAFLSYLNTAACALRSPAAAFVTSKEACRGVTDAFFRATRTTIDQRSGSQWVKPLPEHYTTVERAIRAVGAVTAVLAEKVFDGVDPSKVDPERSRLSGAAAKQGFDLRRKGRRYTSDTDRFWRLKRNPGTAPRIEDPRVYDRWAEGLRQTACPEAIQLAYALARFAGLRFMQAAAIDLYDLLVDSPGEARIPGVNKGSKGARTLTFVLPLDLWKRLLAFIDNERSKASGFTLNDLRLLAADPRRRGQLRGMPVLTEDGRSRLDYDRLYRLGKKAAIAMDLFINDVAYRQTGERKYVTIHLLRHEYVHRRLDRADLMPAKQRELEYKAIKTYMGWSDADGMLDWYSHHQNMKVAMRCAADSAEDTDVETSYSEQSYQHPEMGKRSSAEIDLHSEIAGL